MHTYLSKGARSLKSTANLQIHSFFRCAISEGSDETAQYTDSSEHSQFAYTITTKIRELAESHFTSQFCSNK